METKALVLTADIAAAAIALAEVDELDLDRDKLASRRIGVVMRKLRFEHLAQGGTHKKGWLVGKRELANLALAYGIVNRDPCLLPAETQDRNVTNVTEGHKVTQSGQDLRAEYARVAFDVCM